MVVAVINVIVVVGIVLVVAILGVYPICVLGFTCMHTTRKTMKEHRPTIIFLRHASLFGRNNDSDMISNISRSSFRVLSLFLLLLLFDEEYDILFFLFSCEM